MSKMMNLVNKKANNFDQKIDFIKIPIAKRALFNSHIKEHNLRCLANTKVVLQYQIKEWVKDRDSNPIFWLNGIANTKKSIIAQTVMYLFTNKDQLGTSCVFKKYKSNHSIVSMFFTTIAINLITHLPELISNIIKVINTNPAISKKVLKDQFEKLILQLLLEIKKSCLNTLGLIIVIDKLNECKQEEDIQIILLFFIQTQNFEQVLLRVFVTSKPELSISFNFNKILDKTHQDLIFHNIP